MMRRVRIACQTVSVILFVFSLALWSRSDLAYRVPSQWFLRLNPLAVFVTSLSSRRVWGTAALIALVVMAITMVWGRVFCGFICPLGALIDFSDTFLFGRAGRALQRPPLWLQKLKYVFLIVLVTVAVFGATIPLFFDPLSLTTRVAVLVIGPALGSMKSSVTAWLGAAPGAPSPAAAGSLGALLLLSVIVVSGFWDRRFWCQYVCPTGAFLGFLAQRALWRRRLQSSRCSSCGACARRVCPTRAIIDEKYEGTRASECIVCGLCVQDRRLCSTFAFRSAESTPQVPPVDLSRRHVLAGVTAGLLVAPLYGVERSSGRLRESTILRPPGALPEAEFQARCIACGECIAACPQGIIRACTSEDGLRNIFTPRLDFRRGFCSPECRRCSYVCPTRALQPIPPDAKPLYTFARAMVNRGACVAWIGERPCTLCSAVCPHKAIEIIDSDVVEGISGPEVDRTRCTGCGRCEYECPAKPLKGIFVVSVPRLKGTPVSRQ